MSNSHPIDPKRRRLIKFGALSVAAVPLSQLLLTRPSHAQEQLSEDDPTAKALSYVHDASASDKRTDDTALCSNCNLYQGADGEEWGPCAIFPGKLVKADGWCASWVKKPG
jgi:hypothetical protein